MKKEQLFAGRHPVVRQLEQVDGILMPGMEAGISQDSITLKALFKRSNMDARQVDSLLLDRIAGQLVEILMTLSQLHIYPGVISLSDIIYTDQGNVMITHPEKFQLLTFPQDQEWFPEDEKLFGDAELFDEQLQLMADQRLIYKVLVASTRGNLRVPPRATEEDYSEQFYKALPDRFRSALETGEWLSYETMKEILDQAIAMETRFVEKTFRINEEAGEDLPVEALMQEEHLPAVNVLYVCLRTSYESSRIISQMLYALQDELEPETGRGRTLRQALLYGNGMVRTRDYEIYPRGFRCQFEENIRAYSKGEALIIAAGMVERAMDIRAEDEEFRVYLLAEGIMKNDELFHAGLERISELKEKGVKLQLRCGPDSACEALMNLKTII